MNPHLIAFYFAWHQTPAENGRWYKWQSNDHKPANDDISSFLYPRLGVYSNRDPVVLRRHMKWMKRANIGVAAVSWWGRDHTSDVDARMPDILDAAAREGLQVTIMRDDRWQDPDEFEQDVKYIFDTYADHPAFWKIVRPTRYSPDAETERPVIFQWKSHSHPPPHEWRTVYDRIHRSYYSSILLPNGAESRPQRMDEFHSDGLFLWATVGRDLSKYAGWVRSIQDNGGIACVSTSPGFNNTRHQPDPAFHKVQPRNDGATYDESWSAARSAQPDFINVTAFNVWNESLGIEPAKPRQIAGFSYDDYQGAYGKVGVAAQFAYIDRTQEHSSGWVAREAPFLRISEVRLALSGATGAGEARVTWMTDAAATSRVEYGTSPGSYSDSVAETAMVRSHDILLTGLAPNQTYYLRVVSTRDGYLDSASRERRLDTDDPTEGARIRVVHAFRGILGREPKPQVLTRYAKKLADGTWDGADLCRKLFESPEFARKRANLTPSELAREIFLGMLERPPAQAGLDDLAGAIRNGRGPERSAEILDSHEFADKFL
ncbi:MAG: hypothetical protein GY769_04790 [bacterium]|nr:hypothetical protein [bacterium]